MLLPISLGTHCGRWERGRPKRKSARLDPEHTENRHGRHGDPAADQNLPAVCEARISKRTFDVSPGYRRQGNACADHQKRLPCVRIGEERIAGKNQEGPMNQI